MITIYLVLQGIASAVRAVCAVLDTARSWRKRGEEEANNVPDAEAA